MALVVDAESLEQIIQRSKEALPAEACGLLLGKGGRVIKVRATTNVADSVKRYQVDPDQQFSIFRESEESGWDVLGVYHSHPMSEAYPSQTDLDLSFYPEFYHLIVSLQDEDNPQLSLFRIDNGEVTKEELVTHHKESEDAGTGLKERVQEVLNEVRPSLQRDGGDVEFVDFDDEGVVKVRLTGACAGCPMSQMTLQMGIQRVLQEKIPEVKGVEGV
jgi:Fe-S cluster biogenesis protein NfuA/proteasome lid subunit RPN8/RPN11